MMRTSRFQPALKISRNVPQRAGSKRGLRALLPHYPPWPPPKTPWRWPSRPIWVHWRRQTLEPKQTTAERGYNWKNGSRFCGAFSMVFWWRLIGVVRKLHIWLMFLGCILSIMKICLSGSFPMGISISDWNQMVYSPLRLKKLQWDHGNPPMILPTGDVSRSVQKQMQGTRAEQAEMATKLIFSQKCFC